VRVKENAVNDFRPIFRRQLRRVFPAGFHVFDEVEQQINRSVLSCRPVLIHDGMNGHGRVNAWQVMPALIFSEGFNNRDGTVLAICRKPPPPNNSKDLTGVEVVYALALMLFVLVGWRAKA
jgi:hypothetical protein